MHKFFSIGHPPPSDHYCVRGGQLCQCRLVVSPALWTLRMTRDDHNPNKEQTLSGGHAMFDVRQQQKKEKPVGPLC